MSKAIFISYASQDADAARRLSEALRTEGAEVWFDVDGGLEHGDEWDAKIRRQIKECVLFIPVISAYTQSRLEGYFRIEWELAAQRALGIAAGVPFLLPVVIDDTSESVALVPERFRAVQWTRLPGGIVTPEVKSRFLKLWSQRTGTPPAPAPTAKDNVPPSLPAPTAAAAASAAPARKSRRRPAMVLIGTGSIAAAAAGYAIFRPAPTPSMAMPRGAEMAPTPSEADQLVHRARELIYDPDSARNEFALAETMLRRATELAPQSGAAWGASALLNEYFHRRGYDFSRERLVRAQAEADKALRLDPKAIDALLALGLQRQSIGENERARDFLERAAALQPANPRVILAQASLREYYGARADYLQQNLDRTTTPAELYYYIALNCSFDGRTVDALAALEKAITIKPFWRVWVERASLELLDSADPIKVEAWLERVPELKRDEPRVAIIRYEAAMLRQDSVAALRALNSVANDYFLDNFYEGPKAFLLAQCLELGGQTERAKEQWHLAGRRLREKLEEKPDWLRGRAMLAQTLQAEGEVAESRKVIAACVADSRFKRERGAVHSTALTYLRLGEPAEALKVLLGTDLTSSAWGFLSEPVLEKDRRWEALRSLPDYPALRRMMRDDKTVPKRTR